MKYLLGMVAAVGVAFSAAPVLAFTAVPSSAVASGRQSGDPDAELDGVGSTLRDAFRDNDAASRSGALATGALGFGNSSGDVDDLSAGRAELLTSRSSFGATPSLSEPDLYDGEPPFMPAVVGDHRP